MEQREPTYERVIAERNALKTEALRLFDENRRIRQQDAEITYLRQRLGQSREIVRELQGLIVRTMSPETLGRLVATVVTEQGIPQESALAVVHAVMGHLSQGVPEALQRAEIELHVTADIGLPR